MGKGKNKKNTKPKTDSNPLKSVNLSFPETMSAEDIQHVIARAILEAEEIKTQNDQAQRQKEHEEFLKNLGYKEHKSKIKSLFNRVYIVLVIIFGCKKTIKGDRATFALVKTGVYMIAWILRAVFFILAITALFFIPYQLKHTLDGNYPLMISLIILSVAVSILFFVISGLFRMSTLEIDNINDRNYMFGLFASITSIVSIVVAIIAVIKGV